MGSGQAYCPSAGRLQVCALRSYRVQNWHCPPLEILLPHPPPLILAQETGRAVLLLPIFSAIFSPLLLLYYSSRLVLQVLNSDQQRLLDLPTLQLLCSVMHISDAALLCSKVVNAITPPQGQRAHVAASLGFLAPCSVSLVLSSH